MPPPQKVAPVCLAHQKRGTAASESKASILKDFTGNAVHDCWSPYFSFDGMRHVLCGAHLLRELAGLMDDGSLWAEEMREFLLDLYKMPHPIAAADEVRNHYHVILAHADAEEPPPQPGGRGKAKHSAGRNLLNRLKKHEEGVLAFALEEDVPFTNNQAERDLRPAKVKQKVSGCFRTENGARVACPPTGCRVNFPQAGPEGLRISARPVLIQTDYRLLMVGSYEI